MSGEVTETVLQEAARIIDGQRTDDYGDPEDSFQLIADYWNTYLSEVLDVTDSELSPADVAHMMALLKLARLTTGQPKRDSYVDLAGYAALAARISGVDGKPASEADHRIKEFGQQFHNYCKDQGTLSTLDDVPVESLVRVQPDADPRIPKEVRGVKIGWKVFTRSTSRPGSWLGSSYWPEPKLYEYATKNNMEVEYL